MPKSYHAFIYFVAHKCESQTALYLVQMETKRGINLWILLIIYVFGTIQMVKPISDLTVVYRQL